MLTMYTSSSWAFSIDDVAKQAQSLAGKGYEAPKSNLPSVFRDMKYADYQQIQFNHDKAYWNNLTCTSLGVKLGGGLGTAITGWLLAASHFDSALTVQPDSCINMLKIMYLVIPFALDAIITFILSRMKVEEANEKLREAD